MDPLLRPYFQHFWPWLIWNLLRYAAWYEHTGQDALLAVDRFGNIRIAKLCDAPRPDSLYTWKPPARMPWQRLAPGAALPVPARACAPSCGAAPAEGTGCAGLPVRPARIQAPP